MTNLGLTSLLSYYCIANSFAVIAKNSVGIVQKIAAIPANQQVDKINQTLTFSHQISWLSPVFLQLCFQAFQER